MNRVPLKIGSAEYQLKSEITCGGQGKVYTAINLETEEYIVVKIINLNEGAKWRYYTIETDAILDIEPWKHQYLVNYLYFCEEDEYGIIAMEEYDCDLFDFIITEDERISEDLAKSIFQKICIGLKNMHLQGYAHLDIKLENIMIDLESNIPYLGDFDCCYNFKKNPKCTSFRGTRIYAPPEYAVNQPFDARKSDIYSLGVTLHAMMTKVYPYDINKEVGKRKVQFDNNLSDNCKDLLQKMLKTNPKKRISLDEVMQHPWLSNTKKESKLQKVNQSITKAIRESTFFSILSSLSTSSK